MRPESHRSQEHVKRCGNCVYSAWPECKDHLLCFHGDKLELGTSSYSYQNHVVLDGKDVGFMEGDEYDKVWGGRVVEDDDICNEWRPRGDNQSKS